MSKERIKLIEKYLKTSSTTNSTLDRLVTVVYNEDEVSRAEKNAIAKIMRARRSVNDSIQVLLNKPLHLSSVNKRRKK